MLLRLLALLRTYAPGFALGLFAGRLLSEQWPLLGELNGWLNAAALTATAVLLATLLLRRVPFSAGWPALLLLAYVVFPEVSPRVALGAAGVTALVAAQRSWVQHSQPERELPLWVGAVVTAVLFAALYLITLAPDVLTADNGELQIVATNLGVAHPPGFALYTLLAHLMTRLPLAASPAYKVNLFSALTSTLTLVVVYATVWRLARRHLAALLAVVALGTATTFWAQATTANIRSLTALFAALLFYLLVGFRDATRTGSGRADRYLVLFALALGLGITHHASLAFMGLLCVSFVPLVDRSILRQPRRWIRPFLAMLPALLPLLYFPLRASADVRGARPGLATLDGFLNHVLARGFSGDFFYFIEPGPLWERARVMANVLDFQFAVLLLLGMGLGMAVLLWRDRHMAWLLGGSFLIHTVITATYRAPQTVEYMLPAYVPLALALGAGSGWLLAHAREGWRTAAAAAGVALLVTAVAQGADHFPSYRQLHTSTDARDYAQPILQAAPPNGLILAHWHWATPLWYLQEVEGQRPDVEVRFVFPEGEPYAQTWGQRAAEAWSDGRDVITTHYDPTTYGALPPPQPLHEAFLFQQAPLLELPATFAPLDLALGGRVQVVGVRSAAAKIEIGEETVVDVAWQPGTACAQADAACAWPVVLFAHLVGPDGRIYAQADVPVLPQDTGLTVTQLRLTPRPGAAPDDYSLLLGAYGVEPLLSGDGQARTAVATLSVTAQSGPPATRHTLFRQMVEDPARRLAGYDWDTTFPTQRLYLHWQTTQGYQTEVRDGAAGPLPAYRGPWGIVTQRWANVSTPSPTYYVPFGADIVWTGETITAHAPLLAGESFIWRQHFLSGAPVLRDYAVSVRLIGYQPDGTEWAWWDLDDSIPAMGAIPTLKWIAGSRVAAPHFMQVDPDAPVGEQLGGALALYDAFSNRPLAILDERITAEFAWVPLGETAVAAP